MLLKINSRIKINKIDKGNFFIYIKKAVKSALLVVYFVINVIVM